MTWYLYHLGFYYSFKGDLRYTHHPHITSSHPHYIITTSPPPMHIPCTGHAPSHQAPCTTHAPPMHGPACLSSQTPIRPHLTWGHLTTWYCCYLFIYLTMHSGLSNRRMLRNNQIVIVTRDTCPSLMVGIVNCLKAKSC